MLQKGAIIDSICEVAEVSSEFVLKIKQRRENN